MPLTQEQVEHRLHRQESENVTIHDTLGAVRSRPGQVLRRLPRVP